MRFFIVDSLPDVSHQLSIKMGEDVHLWRFTVGLIITITQSFLSSMEDKLMNLNLKIFINNTIQWKLQSALSNLKVTKRTRNGSLNEYGAFQEADWTFDNSTDENQLRDRCQNQDTSITFMSMCLIWSFEVRPLSRWSWAETRALYIYWTLTERQSKASFLDHEGDRHAAGLEFVSMVRREIKRDWTGEKPLAKSEQEWWSSTRRISKRPKGRWGVVRGRFEFMLLGDGTEAGLSAMSYLKKDGMAKWMQ